MRPPATLAGHPALAALAQVARREGRSVWLCGGLVRDLLGGRDSADLDVAVAGGALALADQLGRALGGRLVPLDPAHDTGRVVWPGGYLDLAGLRAPDLAGDLRARDFTVNAMALPLEPVLAGAELEDVLIDPTGGRTDLAEGWLRAAGPGVLAADPARVLRAFRFMSTHGLRPDADLSVRLAARAGDLAVVAAERVAQEWLTLAAGADPSGAVAEMARLGVLEVLVPELAAGRGMAQNPFHHLDVWGHSLATLEATQGLLADPSPLGEPLASEARATASASRVRARLITAALLHDIGKPATHQEKEPGWASFHRHDIRGAALALARCRAVGIPKTEAREVARLVELHMRPFHLMGAQARGHLSARAVRRFVESVGDDLALVGVLALADTLAGRGPQRPPDAEERLCALLRRVVHTRDQELAARLAAPPLLDGRRLMAALDLSPGPEVGRLLARVRSAQLDGAIEDAEQAIGLARRLLRV